MRRIIRWGIFLLAGVHLAGCAVPHGSFARPVESTEDTNLISLGAMMPFAASVGVSGDGNNNTASSFAQAYFVIPSFAYDRNFGPRHSFGVEVSLLNSRLSSVSNNDTDGVYAVFINPRWEYGVAENFSLTVDGNLGYLSDGDSSLPYLHPTFGIRWYLPTGFGGVILSQQIGTALITFYLPGSVAYDIPIPLGETAKLHVFPEFRWDPTFVFVGVGGAYFVTASGGVSFMLEI